MSLRALPLSLVVPLALALPRCAPPTRPDPPDESARAAASAEAAEASRALGLALMGELSKALAAGEPEHAVDVCARVAEDVAERVSAARGVTVGRTTLRTRNPANAPDAWERAILEEWARAGDPASLSPREEWVETGGSWTLRQLRPIVTLDLCVQCHGDRAAMSPALRAKLAELYPEDTAVGYAPGELRGAFTVGVPLRAD